MRSLIPTILVLLLLVPSGATAQTPAGSEFSYQGRLVLQGSPYTGAADLRFTLYNAAAGGNPVASAVQMDSVVVTAGIFHTLIDFGTSPFDGDARWLEIEVRAPHDPGDSAPFIFLDPRQQLTAVPYALHALSGGGGGGLWQFTGSATTNTNQGFVGVNRSSKVTSAEYFGIQAPVTSGYGGMYIRTDGANGIPFYGFSNGLNSAWMEWNGTNGTWNLVNGSTRMSVQNDGNVGIGVTTPNDKLQVAGVIHSTVGGYRFPDGTLQVTAASGGGGGADNDWLVNGDDLSMIPTDQLVIGAAAAGAGAKVTIEDLSRPATELRVRDDLLSMVQLYGDDTSTRWQAGLDQVELTASNPTSDVRFRLVSSGDLEMWGDLLEFVAGGTRWADLDDTGTMTFYRDGSNPTIVLDNEAGGGVQGGQISLYNDVQTTTATAILDGEYGGGGGGALLLRNAAGEQTVEIAADLNPGDRSMIRMYQPDGTRTIQIDSEETGDPTQGGQITIYNDSGVATIELDGDYGSTNEGRVTTQVLEITGGSDLSENFDVKGPSGNAVIEPGTVVSIDPRSPGGLTVSTAGYDRRVAGIVSGAGGVKPGLLMGQKGSEADGDLPVALTGRVYCKVDASFGSIEPGDLLTTSPTAGHAMKVHDHTRAQGAILGKAMTALDAGQGMVLVLVSLQ